jgi:hypothetical protein
MRMTRICPASPTIAVNSRPVSATIAGAVSWQPSMSQKLPSPLFQGARSNFPGCHRQPDASLTISYSASSTVRSLATWEKRGHLFFGRSHMYTSARSGRDFTEFSRLGSLENRLGRGAHGFEPAADVHLGVGTVGCSQVPLNDCEFLISAFNYKPTDWILTDDPADLALEFLQTRHCFPIER